MCVLVCVCVLCDCVHVVCLMRFNVRWELTHATLAARARASRRASDWIGVMTATRECGLIARALAATLITRRKGKFNECAHGRAGAECMLECVRVCVRVIDYALSKQTLQRD